MLGNRQQGMASVEYVVVTGSLVALLFVPAFGDGKSIIDIVIAALKGFQANSTYLLSMP